MTIFFLTGNTLYAIRLLIVCSFILYSYNNFYFLVKFYSINSGSKISQISVNLD